MLSHYKYQTLKHNKYIQNLKHYALLKTVLQLVAKFSIRRKILKR